MAATKAINYLFKRRYFLSSSLLMPAGKIQFYVFPHYGVQQALYSDQKSITTRDKSDSKDQVQVPIAEVVKENTKSAWYMSVIVAGIGVTAVMFYSIFRELFSSNSPNSVYSKAVEKLLNDPKVADAVGEPIKAYGEETRRGRRGHVSHTVYENNGTKYMRMKFYIQGSRKHGTVHLEMKEDESGNYVYRYMFVQLKDLLRTVIVLEDNRQSDSKLIKTQDDLAENSPFFMK